MKYLFATLMKSVLYKQKIEFLFCSHIIKIRRSKRPVCVKPVFFFYYFHKKSFLDIPNNFL